MDGAGYLPVASQTLDLLLLPHVLEFSAHPHQILREAERVLMPEGSLIISGFNPYSLWGLWRMLPYNDREYPWCGRFISLSRIKDWLALLGLEVVGGRMCCYEPPFRQEPCSESSTSWKTLETAGGRMAGGVYFHSCPETSAWHAPDYAGLERDQGVAQGSGAHSANKYSER